jgi:hypothetical protein
MRSTMPANSACKTGMRHGGNRAAHPAAHLRGCERHRYCRRKQRDAQSPDHISRIFPFWNRKQLYFTPCRLPAACGTISMRSAGTFVMNASKRLRV